MRAFFLFVMLVPGFVSCQNRTGFDYSIFEMGVSKGQLNNPMLTEVSGLVASIENPGMFWVNNDSGDAPQLYLIDSTANLIAIVRLQGVQNRDWEEVAMGAGPDAVANYVYIGEIGDNLSQYPSKSIFRIKDFKVPIVEHVFDTLISEVDQLEFTLPDGPRDSEAMVVDPISKNIFLFSKREEKINLYEIPNWSTGKDTAQAKLLLQLPFSQITAADISTDGTEVIIRNYKAILYWRRDITQPFVSIFDQEQSVLPYSQEPQGEAVAFDFSGKGYYTVSEYADGKIPHLIFYKRKNQ